jgi:hypothetical protein
MLHALPLLSFTTTSGALLLVSAAQPTTQSRQIDIIFARHVNNLTGQLPPPYIHSPC